MDRGLNGKLTLVCAQAGSGKTTLAAEWAKQSDFPVAWVSLDPIDDDFHRFWTCVAVSIDRHLPGFLQYVSTALESVQPPFYYPFAAQLLNALHHFQDRLVVILDDYHVLKSPSINDCLAYVIKHLPDRIHWVIISRTHPNLPLARLAAENELHWVDAHDLSFTRAEGREFYRLMELELSPGELERLMARTEGWVAGLKLSALSLQGRGAGRPPMHASADSRRFVAEYLFQEVLAQQPEQVQSFLLRTSILNRLCAPLCEEVAACTNGQSILEKLEDSNLFIVPLDDAGNWYRYHYLFADFLQERLQLEMTGVRSELHRRAAEWYERNHEPAEAIEHYLAGKYEERAVRLILDLLPVMVERSWETLYRWLKALPDKVLESQPDLYFAKLFFAAMKEDWPTIRHKIEQAEAYYHEVRSTLSAEDTHKYLAYLHLVKSYIAVDYTHDHAAAVAHSRKYLEYKPDSVSLHQAYTGTDDISVARAFTGVEGKLSQAEPFFRNMLEVWKGHDSPYTGMFCSGLADILYERNRLQEAREFAWRGYAIGREHHCAQVLASAALLLSKIDAITYSPDRAVSFLQKTAELLRNNRYGFWSDLLDDQILRFRIHHLSHGDLQSWWDRWHWLLEEDIPAAYLFQAITLTRVLIVLGRWEEADYWLMQLRLAAETKNRLGEQIEIITLQGLLNMERNQVNQAAGFIAQALTLAEPEKYVRTFLDEGRPMLELLSAYLQQANERGAQENLPASSLEFLQYLNREFRNEYFYSQPCIERAGIDPLTEKEWEVLQLLAERLPNRQIASRMNITVGTVKTHLHRIYEKLCVRGRWEAIEVYNQKWKGNG